MAAADYIDPAQIRGRERTAAAAKIAAPMPTYTSSYPAAIQSMAAAAAPAYDPYAMISPLDVAKASKPGVIPTEPTPQEKAKDTPAATTVNPAFAIIENTLKNYGMEGIAAAVAKVRADYPEINSVDLLTLLKVDSRYNEPYLKRFAGNAALMKKGLPTLDDATYLKVEKEYEKILKGYGTGLLATRENYATFIGNSMDAADVTDRIILGYDRLKADKNTLTAFRTFFPGLADGDVVAAMLNPEVLVPELERKVKVAEIAGSALAAGLEANQVSAQSLADFGVTKPQSQIGYQKIAYQKPRGEFLTAISPEEGIKYTQGLAEDIEFKKDAKAIKQQEMLIEKEKARLSGQSGIARGALSSPKAF